MSTTLQGKFITPQNNAELWEAIGQAFDYRGDVTLSFKDGSDVKGYLYKFDPEKDEVFLFVETEPKSSISKRLAASEIKTISFTGEDCAFGKSWEDYQAKKAQV